MAKDRNEQFLEFEKSCTNMVNSKYVMIDRSISQILKAIAKNKEIFNIIAEQVINFNFAFYYDFARQEKCKFVLPDENDLKVAFCFCLLNEIDNKNINVTNLISDYFDKNIANGYKLFCDKIIVQFLNSVKSICCENTSVELPYVCDDHKEKVYDKFLTDRILFVLNDIQIKINADKKLDFETKFNASTVCSVMVECLISRNTSPVLALFLGLKSICEKNKSIKNEILDLKKLICE